LAVIAVTVAGLAVGTVSTRPTIAGLLGLVVVAICLGALYRVTFAGSFAPVAVTFWAFVAVWVGVAPLLQLRDNRFPWPDLPLDQHHVTAQVIVVFATVAYWTGHSFVRSATRRPLSGPMLALRLDITVEKAIVVTGFGVLMAVVCLPRTGGLRVRFTDRDELQSALVGAGLRSGRDLALLGLLNTLPAAISVAALVLCLLCWRNRSYAGAKAKRILMATTLVAVTLNIVYNNPLTANRFASFSVLLAGGLALVSVRRQRWRSAFSAGMLLGLAVVYPLANSFRNERYRDEPRLGLEAYYSWDFDGFQQTVNAVHYVGVHGHTWGHHLVSALLFWVPRSLWEGKAIPAGNVVAANRGYEFQNLALPFWTEVFVEFTLVGVIVAFFWYGRLSRRLDRTLDRTPADLATALTVMFAACQIGLLRGPLGAQIPFVGAAFVVLLAGVAGWRGRSWRLTRPPDDDRDAMPGKLSGGAGRPIESAGGPERQPLRIALLSDWWWPDVVGGAELSARAVAIELARFAEVRVFVPAAADRVYADGPLVVHAVRRPFARRRHADSVLRHGLEFGTTWLLPTVAARLARGVADFAPRMVVAHNVSRTGPWLLRMVGARGLPLVRVYHDLSDTCWRRSRLKGSTICATVCGGCRVKTSVMRRATPRAAVAVCVSGFVRAELDRAGLVELETATVAYPLVGSRPVEPVPRPSRTWRTVIGYLGRLSPVKGVESAIRTVAAYQRSTGGAVSMVIAGEGSPGYVRELMDLADSESVEVDFAGRLDVDEFCARVDAVLIPSTWMEPFGRVAVEVGSRGRPALVSPLGGLPEAAAVSGGRHAFADFRDPEVAARALADLLDGDCRGGVGGAARPENTVSLADGVVSTVRQMLGLEPGVRASDRR